MQITETLALADLTAVISITIAAIVAITGYRNTKHSARQTFDNFTLRFIETENADPHLYNARQWLGQAAMQSDTDLADYADIAAYFKKHGLSGLSIRSRADGGIESYTVSQNPAAQNLLHGYLQGSHSLTTLVEARNTAAEALLHGLLEENAYRLVRCRAFLHDYARIQNFIRAKQKHDAGYAQAFCELVRQWGADSEGGMK
ncbi:hypothetical protein [uncultured Neisseria sp.]|uniref:DUF4760 domain-containing protein n=1 Tax=uncultured Neisseria sp. TaxID=237778 RepID=UPI0025F8E8F2|nr:hypothetical protein [uncultured Neisseria sp.]